MIAVSAKTGRGLERLLDHVEALFAKHTGRIPTAALNRRSASCARRGRGPPSAAAGCGLLYGTQVSTRPPRFRIFVNDPRLVTRDYGYWVENELRQTLLASRACRSRSTSSRAE